MRLGGAACVQEQLHSWMLDKTGRDQFVIKHGDEVVVLWNDGRRCRADEAYKRAFWTGGLPGLCLPVCWDNGGTLPWGAGGGHGDDAVSVVVGVTCAYSSRL
jgi:hypothetical protein